MSDYQFVLFCDISVRSTGFQKVEEYAENELHYGLSFANKHEENFSTICSKRTVCDRFVMPDICSTSTTIYDLRFQSKQILPMEYLFIILFGVFEK